MRRANFAKQPFLTVEEYAELMYVNANAVRRLCRDNKLEGVVRIGNKTWRIANPLINHPKRRTHNQSPKAKQSTD